MIGLPKTPKFLIVEINQKCNLSCPFCYVKKTGEEMKEEIIHSLLRIAPYFNILYFFGGEPFLSPDKMLEAIKNFKKTNYYSFGVCTNGTLLTKKSIIYWLGKGISTWKISLHRENEYWLLDFFEDLLKRANNQIDVRFVKFFETIYDFQRSDFKELRKKYKHVKFSLVFPYEKNSYTIYYKTSFGFKSVRTRCNFNIYVDIKGDVYPCIKKAIPKKIGHIIDDFEKVRYYCDVFSKEIRKCVVAQYAKNRGLSICELSI